MNITQKKAPQDAGRFWNRGILFERPNLEQNPYYADGGFRLAPELPILGSKHEN
jgi:hypothetical protein